VQDKTAKYRNFPKYNVCLWFRKVSGHCLYNCK